MARRKYTDEYQDFVQMLQNKLSDNVSVNDDEALQVQENEIVDINDTSDF